ncbi:sigma-54-dependent transcriptional regulator [Pararcticibacter amylolyticus]|uniref:Sigma-54-dependent Fis family transcriptional regulator n=1 Tax=Pararcticibacter amylolyticus TaxID=2173175 RepID=A0A2U2PFB5_9SPHI|nr:sigma-54 dependent transcriptional regulator [Pararcticibacter amylolyticus]PWG80095.1 sigma-54-dependent Fis family transcriptional regulator [Pararcticibacter amylolyticus]
MADILLVEDDTTFSLILENYLQKKGHKIVAKYDVKSGIKALEQKQFDLLLLDYRLPDGNGLQVLSAAGEKGQQVPAVIMTSFNDVRTAVRAMRSGAFDYITKPVNPDELSMILNEALEEKEPAQPKRKSSPSPFIEGESEASRKLHEYIGLVAPTDMTIIIQGESGTGKEYVASSIHKASKRTDQPFIAIDCGSLSKDLAASELFGHIKGAFTGALQDKKGQFEAANGGTLFLDEVGNLSYDVQVQLLRAIQERVIQPLGSNNRIKVDVRIITATNEDLLSAVSKGDFREDLYHRLNEFKIQVPALRNRENDLSIFIKHFIDLANTELDRNVKRLSPEVSGILMKYDWPGNLRELKNVIKRMVLLTKGEEAGVEALPDEMISSVNQVSKPSGSDLKAINEANEKELIIETLRKVKYNKSQAAKLLNIDRTTLYNKIEKYQIE